MITDTNWVWSDQETSNWNQVNFDDSTWKHAYNVAKTSAINPGGTFSSPAPGDVGKVDSR